MMRRGMARLVPVPKEIILPVCQRLFFVCFVMCITALGLRLYTLWKLGKLGNHSGPVGAEMESRLRGNGTHFYLDIGSSASGSALLTQKLDENGWNGICVDPFPDASLKRNCSVLKRQVASKSAQKLWLEDCSNQRASPVLMSLMPGSRSKCPVKEVSTISILDALKLFDAPSVIDYVNIDTSQGMELDILSHFPFDRFCTRSWNVRYGDHANISAGVQQLLKSQGCRIEEMGPSYWARCSCSHLSEHGRSALSSALEQVPAATAAGKNLMRKAAKTLDAEFTQSVGEIRNRGKKKSRAKDMAPIEPTADQSIRSDAK